jgi:hypothetical protein
MLDTIFEDVSPTFEEFGCYFCGIEELPEGLLSLPNLNIIEVPYGSLEEVDLTGYPDLYLTKLNVSGHNISTILMTDNQKDSLTDLDVSSNELDFADLEPLYGVPLSYTNQDVSFDPVVPIHYMEYGEDSVFYITELYGVEVDENNTRYQWAIDGIYFGFPSFTPELTVSDMSNDQIGDYKVKMTNDHFPDLTFETETFALDVVSFINEEELGSEKTILYKSDLEGIKWGQNEYVEGIHFLHYSDGTVEKTKVLR